MEETIQRIVYDAPVKIEMERGQRGGVGWTITVRGDDPVKILEQIGDIDHKLKTAYTEGGT